MERELRKLRELRQLLDRGWPQNEREWPRIAPRAMTAPCATSRFPYLTWPRNFWQSGRSIPRLFNKVSRAHCAGSLGDKAVAVVPAPRSKKKDPSREGSYAYRFELADQAVFWAG